MKKSYSKQERRGLTLNEKMDKAANSEPAEQKYISAAQKLLSSCARLITSVSDAQAYVLRTDRTRPCDDASYDSSHSAKENSQDVSAAKKLWVEPWQINIRRYEGMRGYGIHGGSVQSNSHGTFHANAHNLYRSKC
jgi:hypothetical protein